MTTKTYLEELKKIIILGQMGTNNSYHDLYEYICKTQRNLKILLIIDNIIMERITTKRKILKEESQENFNIESGYDEYPIVEEIFKKILINGYLEYETLEMMEEGSLTVSKHIKKLETTIYNQILKEINEIEKKYSKGETSTSNNIEIEQLKEKIIKECICILEKIEVNRKKLVKDGKIDEETLKEIYNMLDDATIHQIHELIKIETEKTNIYYELKKTFEILDNINNIFDNLALDVIKEQLEKIDKEIVKNLENPKYKKEKEELIRNNHYEEETLAIGSCMPEYIKKFDLEIYTKINKRCRIMKLFTTINEKSIDTKGIAHLSETEKKAIKENLKEQIQIMSIEDNEIKSTIEILKEMQREFKNQKEKELINLRTMLIEKENMETLIETKKTKKLKSLYLATCNNTMTPLEAIYAYDILIIINESTSNIELYRKLIEFIDDKEIEIISPEIELAIKKIANEQFGIYFHELKSGIMKAKNIK